MTDFRHGPDESYDRAEDARGEDYLDEQRRDRAAERAPLPDFEPRTLGERHSEALANIDRGLDRAEQLAAECQERVQRLLGGEPA